MATTILAELADLDATTARIFAATYGLTMADAYRATFYTLRRGSERCARALLLVETTGCTFLAAAQAVESADAPLYTAPLNGKQPAMITQRACIACGDPTANADYCQACRELGEASRVLVDNERIALREMAEVTR